MSRSQALSACSPESTGGSPFAKPDETSVPLRLVTGITGLRLLRELRPRVPSSLDSEELAGVVSTGGDTRVPAFRSLTRRPCRRPALPPGALTAGRNEGSTAASVSQRAQTGSVSRSASGTKSRAVSHRDLYTIEEASNTGFVSSPWILW